MTARLRKALGSAYSAKDDQYARNSCYVNNPPDVRYTEIGG